jgi:hypothetical protein
MAWSDLDDWMSEERLLKLGVRRGGPYWEDEQGNQWFIDLAGFVFRNGVGITEDYPRWRADPRWQDKPRITVEKPTEEVVEFLRSSARAVVGEFYVTGDDRSDYNRATEWLEKLSRVCTYPWEDRGEP